MEAIKTIRIFIYEYEDGTLSMECNHMHYLFDNKYNRDDVKKDELYDIMKEMRDSAENEGWSPRFVIR